MYAQILEISTAVPSNPIELGTNGTGQFTSTIVNTSKVDEKNNAQIMRVQLELPKGVILEPSSVSLKTIEDVDIPVTLQGTTLVTDYLLEPQTSIRLNYSVKTDCGVIPTTVGNKFSVFASNTVNVTYDVITNEVLTSADMSMSESSQNYEIIYPNLYVYVGSTTSTQHDNNKAVEWKVETTDIIKIENIEKAGTASAIDFEVTWNVADVVENLSFTVNGAPIEATITERGATFRINQILEAGQSLIVVPTFTPKKYVAQLQGTYKAFVVTADETCAGQNNATGIVNYTQIQPAPQISFTINEVVKANFCDNKYEVELTYTLGASMPNDASNTILNNYLEVRGSNIIIESVQFNNAPLQEGERTGIFYLPGSNLDGDGVESDFAAGTSYSIRVIATLTGDKSKSRLDIINYATGIDQVGISNWKIFGAISTSPSVLSVISPTDSNEGNEADYSVSYNFGNYNFHNSSNNSMLDIERAFVSYNGIEVFDTPISNDLIGPGSQQAKVISVCNDPQLFEQRLQTKGCDETIVLGSVNGIAIIECDMPPGEAGCYGFNNTEVAPIVPNQVNTCTTIPVQATTDLMYLCKDTQFNCGEIKQVIARVYDLNGQVEFTSLSSNLLVNGNLLEMTENYSQAVNKGLAWIVDVSLDCNSSIINEATLALDASIMINGNHALPDMSNVNLRVEFSVVNTNGDIISGKSKGTAFTVFDPEPKIQSNHFYPYACEPVLFRLYTTKAVVGQIPVVVQEIKYPAVEGISYKKADGTLLSENTSLVLNPNSAAWNNSTYNAVNLDIPTSAKCIINNTIPIAEEGYVIYTDFYKSCDENTTITEVIKGPTRYSSPIIELNSSIEQGLTTFTNWNLTVKNTGLYSAPFVTLKIKPSSSNEVDLILSQVFVDSVLQTPTIINDAWYITIQNLKNNGGESRVRIRAAAKDCQDHGNSIIDVSAAWSCINLLQEPDVEAAFDDFSCNDPVTTQLQMQNMLAILESTTTYPDQGTTYKMCEPIPIALDIYNSGRAALSELGLVFLESSFPKGTSMIDNVIRTQYDGAHSSILFGDDFIFHGDKDIYLSFEAKNSELSKRVIATSGNPHESPLPTRTTDNDIIKLQFNMMVECTDDAKTLIKALEFKTTATSNCGAEQQRLFNYYLPIAGLEQVQQIGVTASATPFATQVDVNISTLTVVMTNNSLIPLEQSALTIALPDGVITTTPSGAASIHGYTLVSKSNTNGASNIKLTAPAAYSIPAGESRTFTLQLQETLACPQLESIATVSGSIALEIDDCGGGKCPVEAATTETVIDLLRIHKPLTITIEGPTELCQADTATLTARGADSYVWSTGSTVATTTAAHPDTTYTVTGTTTEGCEGTASHTITFIQKPDVPLLWLEIADTIRTNNTIDVADWYSIGEAIIKVSPEGGTLEKQSGPANGCGVYTYTYTLTNICGSTTADLQFEVVNCIDIECVENDLVLIEGKPGYTLGDLHVLSYYLEYPELFDFSRSVYTIVVEDPCEGPIEYELNPCFLEYADFNKDGVIDIHDKHILEELILRNY